MKTVVIGMSGGVDSSVAAILLKKAGYNVIGLFMRNWDSTINNDYLGNPNLNNNICPQEQDYNDALEVCRKINIPLHRVDFVKEYWDFVFTYFLEELKKGRTPNPDVMCNKYIKFDLFVKEAKKLGADYIATGHYARLIDGKLAKAVDKNKDQSYFLAYVNKDIFKDVLFPLGEIEKPEVRKIASEYGLVTASKKDSTGICFIGERNFTQFLENYLPNIPGDIVNIDTGEVLGKHIGLMYYDEVMSFTFMFSDCRELGESNPDKYFFVMDGYYGNLGLFTIRSKIEVCLRYALSKGMEPVVRIVKSGESFYSDYSGDDIWGKFFNQPGDYSLDDVMHSKHVFFSPGFYNGSVQSNIMSQMSKGISLDWKHGVLNNNLIGYIAERKNKYLPYPQRTLGVLARGTDFVNTHLHNHPIHASKEMIADRIDEALRDWNLDYVYIATEDAVYCEFFKERYGDKVFFTDQQRYVTRQNELLSELHRSEEVKRAGFELGAEYAASINLLSQCNSLIASGGCGGVDEALRENAGGYEHVYVFDLGTNR